MDYSSLDVVITSSSGAKIGPRLARAWNRKFATKPTSHGSDRLWKRAHQRRIKAEKPFEAIHSLKILFKRLRSAQARMSKLSTCALIQFVFINF